VTANELPWGDFHLELLAQLNASFQLGLAATIGNENIGPESISLDAFSSYAESLTL
jgi:hypothetical protein